MRLKSQGPLLQYFLPQRCSVMGEKEGKGGDLIPPRCASGAQKYWLDALFSSLVGGGTFWAGKSDF